MISKNLIETIVVLNDEKKSNMPGENNESNSEITL